MLETMRQLVGKKGLLLFVSQDTECHSWGINKRQSFFVDKLEKRVALL
jgi:hypothetical protein